MCSSNLIFFIYEREKLRNSFLQLSKNPKPQKDKVKAQFSPFFFFFLKKDMKSKANYNHCNNLETKINSLNNFNLYPSKNKKTLDYENNPYSSKERET